MKCAVMDAVLRWLGAVFPNSTIRTKDKAIEVFEIKDGYSIGYEMAHQICINCDPQLAEHFSSLGQCLDYCVESGFVPTYLAVPYDDKNIERLERMINSSNLPIGLLTVNQKGEVKVRLKPHSPEKLAQST